MIEEIVGLGLVGVGADRDDGVGELGILVAVVEFADAHVARRMHLGIVGRAIVDADVLDLHRLEIELARAPGVLVAAAGAAVVEGRDEQIVLAAGLLDHRDRHARDEIERVVPGRRLHLAVAEHHRLRQALLLRRPRAGVAHLGHARAADRAEAGVHLAGLVGLDDDVHVLPVLLHDVVHRRRIPGVGIRVLLLGQIGLEDVLGRIRAALLVHRPGVGVIAAADDAEMAGDVLLLGVRRDDRQTVDLALECHGSILPSEHVRQTAVDQLIHAFGEDVAVGRDAQRELRQVLRGLTHDLQPALLAVEARIVAGAVERLVGRRVVEREALVRAERREGDDVAVRTGAARNTRAELDQHAGRVLVRVADVDRRVGLELRDVGEPVGRIVDPAGVGLALASPGSTVAAAAPAVASAPPRRNWRRPTSTSLSHPFIVFLPLIRRIEPPPI